MKAILQTCVDVEERVGEIYQQLVKHLDVNDEMRHAHRIRLVTDRLEMPGITDCGVIEKKVREFLDHGIGVSSTTVKYVLAWSNIKTNKIFSSKGKKITMIESFYED